MPFLGLGHSNSGNYQPAEIYLNLRQQALTLDPAAIGFQPTEVNPLRGLLMETGYPEAVASLVAIADGTVSMYFSNGGGIIGAGQHEEVRRAGLDLLAAAPGFLAFMQPAQDYPLPGKGRVRFYLLTADGAFTAEAGEKVLGSRRAPLSLLFFRAHEVITQVRLAEEKRRSGGGAASEEESVPLIEAAREGDACKVRALLETGTDPEIADSTGLTPLMAAAYLGEEEIVHLLLTARCIVDAKDSQGYTALMFAANAGRLACIQILLEYGAAVDTRDNDDSTPLMFAAQHGHDDVVRMLLSAGADPKHKGRHGLSAISFAQQNGLRKTESILRTSTSGNRGQEM